MGPQLVLGLQVRGVIGVMTMKEYFIYPIYEA